VTETIEPMPTQIDLQQLTRELVEMARADGIELRRNTQVTPASSSILSRSRTCPGVPSSACSGLARADSPVRDIPEGAEPFCALPW
jgi:hypothetical protein